MRIITGELRGRTLRVPRDAAFRPTTDRVKESIFNILGGIVDWESTSACDLFAGSGNLGIEALSRGAQRCSFVEQSRDSLVVLDRNIAELGLSSRAQIVRRSVEQFLRQHSERFGLILADPPYRYTRVEEMLAGIAPLLEPGGIVVLEHEGERPSVDTDTLRIIDRREYGTTAVTFYHFANGEQS
ncbi:MAG: 16S rRNA (guanine(966)-N(2))-methyltransferase RsmD [Bacteroidetes bacterium]|nr:16S rRNA (guanine(966)-N(2))-methyltransferase RsmD [Bacteroidota bacterium]